ncbi:UTP18_2 [Sanghuangporus weigelae]
MQSSIQEVPPSSSPVRGRSTTPFCLQSGATTRSPRGLWGCNPAHFSTKAADLGMELVAFDPSGAILAVAGRRGYVHLVDWRSGSAQVAGSVKMNSGVQGLWWNRHPGLDGRLELLTLGADAEVYVWDVGERRLGQQWPLSEHRVKVRPCQRLRRRCFVINVIFSKSQPRKTLQNLTTSISTLRFNHDSQCLQWRLVSRRIKCDGSFTFLHSRRSPIGQLLARLWGTYRY